MVIRPRDKNATPFEFGVNLYNQFRYTGIDAEVNTFTNRAGESRPIYDRSTFDINRGFVMLSGYALDSILRYFTLIDYNTLNRPQLQLIISWCGYQFSEALTVDAGLDQLPGTWEWLVPSRYVQGAERTMATPLLPPLFDGWNLGYRATEGNVQLSSDGR